MIRIKRVSRIHNPQNIDIDYINAELREGKAVIVQFSDSTYTDDLLSILNELCELNDEHFSIRFYGHYSSSFDFKTLLKIPKVKSLYVDGLIHADNILALAELAELKSFFLGVSELKETEILKIDSLKQLTTLTLGATKTKTINLEYLTEYKKLQSLMIGEHNKNIDAIGELSCLESLCFSSLKKTPVSFVNKLKRLNTLSFILGGRGNLHEIEDNEIENLEIVWVRGFNNLDNISRFKKLQTLLIENNAQLPEIHFDKELPDLRDLKILNCKTFNSLTGLENLTALTQLRIYKTNLDFTNVIRQKLSPTLKTVAFYTTKKKNDEQIRTELQKKGYSEYSN